MHRKDPKNLYLFKTSDSTETVNVQRFDRPWCVSSPICFRSIKQMKLKVFQGFRTPLLSRQIMWWAPPQPQKKTGRPQHPLSRLACFLFRMIFGRNQLPFRFGHGMIQRVRLKGPGQSLKKKPAFARLWNDVWWIGNLPMVTMAFCECQTIFHASKATFPTNISWFRPSSGQSVASSEEPTSVEASSGCFTTRPGRIFKTPGNCLGLSLLFPSFCSNSNSNARPGFTGPGDILD